MLAGGTARRLGGLDKPALAVAGRTLLDRVLDAVPTATDVVVVGPPRATGRAVRWAREEPPGGGPVAALAAGLATVTAPRVLLLAGDLPFLTPAAVSALLDGLVDGTDAVLAVDDAGRDQPLCAAWRTDGLRTALPAAPAGAALRALLRHARVVRLALPAAPAGPPPWWDCDTPGDLEQARSWTAGGAT